MEKRKIKVNKNEVDVSLLGFGCMRFPEKDGKVDVEESRKMIGYAIEKGVNYIDTAWPYHGGKSELIVKEIMKDYPRESYYLADKLPLWEVKTNEDIDRIFHEQLEKCGVEYFDFYLIHAVNKQRYDQTVELKVIDQLEKFRDEGKIKNIGFSFHDDLETFKKWANLYDWDFCQIQLNYMDIEHQQGMEGYDILTEKGIPVIIMEPVKGGSLVKFNDDIEKLMKDERPEDSIASWGFRWLGSLPNVKVILSGMSNMVQVIDNVKTFTDFEPFNEKEYKIINKVRDEVLSLQKVDCTACNYCMPCPFGVDIPGNFRVYNTHSMYKNDGYVKWVYGNMKESEKSANICVSCGECLPKCPQYIQIPTVLGDFEDYLDKNGLK